ncbi:UDP-N-acetylmuramate:L-alanyl-gamma-D-glutamyl-meso-diaminopimelate ligase [Colwellia sp. 4_MG-2023]|jgi:UDP-N-acetylmuramate: L-alanyl-gamma-D-glutamyl-meso-diaminopimelate ligase|uniref:UDP-N-acetylmuramate:L-alanyl-gamma-D-glutamyl- meso-diaminopimelate ligase n=1 Tax=unclassified Colwellia TaxID=196834 RepID=UPI0026E4966B|nr:MULTISPECIES: UDP-N-acetylmuramate:L-alanyl-gamma-D-glutamyl-meso-diaminopimelate ligase [unclassified Colwellia]MDO6506386.1 UDP-N-acetylmuramate:L-alanyl-gamma-D-glutamyl-meso-diaminopimelate ligase [Colwellia sp. 5_MG-2023]MDO6555210.1 UDP-N-acetylmuramate:L-alanyl-gamma-D-glutamyl-meso-diaminopimelate ligase [Colwellia sp. 4_MG-2023]
MTNKIQHIHILGICGTFMGGIAALAKELGFRVTGCDAQVYPPMSTQLEELGIELMQGYKTEHFDDEPDLVIVGNAMSRGNVMVEYILDRNIPYISGPQWLLENVLKNCWVLAVSGTHGKTTTSSMLTWILEYAQLSPGFLIGGVPQNFNCSARLGNTPFFVIEADEYDTAFFDKRSKFVHYRPRTLVINNLEFDHGDIFNDLSDIQRQFHHLIRMVPSNGLILSPKNEFAINETLAMGCWTPTEQSDSDKGWQANKVVADGSEFIVTFNGKEQGTVKWGLIGDFNIDNALMAIAAARHAGVPSHIAIEALAEFINTKRRLELRGTVNQIKVYDDFAHHPTAIAKTLAGVRAQVDGNNSPGRVIAVLEPRSNTMKSGVHKDTLPGSLAQADQVFLFQGEQVKWSVSDLINNCQQPCIVEDDINQLVNKITDYAQAGDSIVVMSNGSFSSIHEKLLQRLDLK